jgi:hypothetical protein
VTRLLYALQDAGPFLDMPSDQARVASHGRGHSDLPAQPALAIAGAATDMEMTFNNHAALPQQLPAVVSRG